MSPETSHAAPPEVEVRRSARRRRTVAARFEGDRIVVLLPAGMGAARERAWVERMVERLQARRPSGAGRGDADLMRRSVELSRRHLDGRARPACVRWVPEMRTRWASCTPADGTIRVSERLRRVPDWVLDYVLVHELAHLLESGHGPAFWAWVQRYPRTERAVGYLQGLAAADDRPPGPTDGRARDVGGGTGRRDQWADGSPSAEDDLTAAPDVPDAPTVG